MELLKLIELRSLMKYFDSSGFLHVEVRHALSDHLFYVGEPALYDSLIPVPGFDSFSVALIDFVPAGKEFPIIYIIEKSEVIKL